MFGFNPTNHSLKRPVNWSFFVSHFRCKLAFSVVAFTLLLAPLVNGHPQDEDIILDIEMGSLQIDPASVESEYQGALERKRQRKLEAMSWPNKLKLYVISGFDHIIPKGLDHILFVLGLFFSSLLITKLLWQITAFTVAHSLTLGLASIGTISISSNIVEPLIALSIAWVAFESCVFRHPKKWRILVIFVFGLLHGLGFASVLSDYGLPKSDFLISLAAFNVGVELGQISVVAIAAILTLWFRKRSWYRKESTNTCFIADRYCRVILVCRKGVLLNTLSVERVIRLTLFLIKK